MDLSPQWAATRRRNGDRHSPYRAFSQSFGGEEGKPDRWCWREIQFPAVLRPEKIAQYAPVWDASTLSFAGIADELRPLDRGYDSVWPLVGIKANRIIFDNDTSFGVSVLYESAADLSSLPLNARFPTQWEHVLGITVDTWVVYNRDHNVFKKINVDTWRDYNNLRSTKTGIDLVAAVASGDSTGAACFLAGNVGNGGDFWNALRDNCPEELSKIFVRAGLDSPEANFKVWQTQYQGGIRSISASGAEFNQGYIWKGELLPPPTEAEWFINPSRRRRSK